jgi:hypothetical protein
LWALLSLSGPVQAQHQIDVDRDGVPDFAITSWYMYGGPGSPAPKYPGQVLWGKEYFTCYGSNSVYTVGSTALPVAYPYPAEVWEETPQLGHGWSWPGSSHEVQDYNQEWRPSPPPFSQTLARYAYRRGLLGAPGGGPHTVFFVVRFMTFEGWRLGWVQFPIFGSMDVQWEFVGPGGPVTDWIPSPFPPAESVPIAYGFSTGADLTRFRPGPPPPPTPPKLTLRLHGEASPSPQLYFEVPPDLGWQQIEFSRAAFGEPWHIAGPGFTNSTVISFEPGNFFARQEQLFFRLR